MKTAGKWAVRVLAAWGVFVALAMVFAQPEASEAVAAIPETTTVTVTETPVPITVFETTTTTVTETPQAEVGAGVGASVGSDSDRRRTGRSGHPCLPGERDGDGDGYCGESR